MGMSQFDYSFSALRAETAADLAAQQQREMYAAMRDVNAGKPKVIEGEFVVDTPQKSK